ncbi:dolichyldiphosphatase [Aureococcus anophagefferens]|nr:dolichyldiphosphatase [Aureococcus anophagefferens]
MARKPFSLTYVTYEEGDSVGLVCALLALAPVFIIVAYATLLVCAGLGFGSVFAAGWIEAYGRLLRPRLGGWVRKSPVCRYLLVRDCAHVADVLRVDYDAAMRRLGSSSPRKKRS